MLQNIRENEFEMLPELYNKMLEVKGITKDWEVRMAI